MKSVLGLTYFSPPLTLLTPSTTTSKPSSNEIPARPSSSSSTILPFPLKSQQSPQANLRRKFLFLALALEDDNNNTTSNKGEDGSDPLRKDDDENKQKEIRENGGENGNGNGNGRPRLNLKWVDLLLDPDPDNVVAVGLTGVLAWASVQVLWQLFVISITILLAALKYSFVAALLIFILITLL